jgi:hypothetical protein
MKRIDIAVLNFLSIIVGFVAIYSNPLSSLAVVIGMLLISISIVSFTILIYFPPSDSQYVKLRVVESPERAVLKAKKVHRRPKKLGNAKRKAKKKRK